MVGDMTEVTQLLCEAVENNNNKNEQKENESVANDVKSRDADTIDKSTLDETIQSYVKNNRHDTEDIALKAPSNDGSNNDDEDEDDNQNNDSPQSRDSSARSSSDQDSYYYDSYCNNFDESGEDECPSDFDKWLKQNQKKFRQKIKLKLHSD